MSDGKLKNGGEVPFIQIIMKGFVGQPMAVRAEFDPEKMFKNGDAGAIIIQALREACKAIVIQAQEANIWLLNAPIKRDE